MFKDTVKDLLIFIDKEIKSLKKNSKEDFSDYLNFSGEKITEKEMKEKIKFVKKVINFFF